MEERELVSREELEKTLDEYRQFAFKSDMIKIATAFILGNAFNGVVNSLSSNLFMPFINFIILQTSANWRDAKWTPVAGLTFETGKAIGSFVDFVLISMVLFFLIKWLGKLDVPPISKKKKKSPR